MTRISIFTASRFILPIILSTMACTAYADTFVHDDLITDPIPSRFNICHGGTCENIADVSFNEQQWQSIKDLFTNNKTAEDERRSIRLAIAKIETIVGRLTDTYNDKGENESDKQSNHYMDCIDESTNTTIYMTMMQKDGLIQLHNVEDRENRGFF